MLRAGEVPPGAPVTFLPRGKAASIARASGGFAPPALVTKLTGARRLLLR